MKSAVRTDTTASSAGRAVRTMSTTVWQCPGCKNTNGNFAHKLTCAACGEHRPAPVAGKPEAPHAF